MERESSPPPELEPSEADFREKVRKIENFENLIASDKMTLLALLCDAKPSMMHIMDFDDEMLKIEEFARTAEQNVRDFAQLLDDLGLTYTADLDAYAAGDGWPGGYFVTFTIGKDAAAAERLRAATFAHGITGRQKDIGLALGYTPSAVEAFVNHACLPPEDLPEEIIMSDLLGFIKYRVSKDHLEEDLELARREMEVTKRESPQLYEAMVKNGAERREELLELRKNKSAG